MTAALFRSLGGWSPDPDTHQAAFGQALSHPADATAALQRLGVPEPDRAVQRLAELARLADSERLASMHRHLALSPDPTSAAQAVVTWLESGGGPLEDEALAVLVALSGQSQFLARLLARHPPTLARLLAGGGLAEARARTELDGLARAVRSAFPPGDEQFALALRDLRRLELARIYYREVLGLASVEVTCREVADVAGALIHVAFERARAELAGDLPPLPTSIIGLGKLGSHELNFSSDVDILFVADEAVLHDETLARHGEAVARRTRELLDTPLANGRVFRVDLRLRPDGTMGPLIAFPRGLRNYYSRIARTWERAALLRARVVAGEPGPGEEALQLLDPFRHPRQVEPAALDDLRAMKDRIDRHEAWRGATGHLSTAWDTKVGQGGIREIEFVVAAFQYLLAYQRPELRGVSTFEGLERLSAARLLDPGDAADLLAAYGFYRRLEHRLQMDEDRQTQRLPSDELARHRLARRLGFATWASLDARLGRHRGRVREIFERMLASQPSERPRRTADDLLDGFTALIDGDAERDEVLAAFEKAGFARPRSVVGALSVLYRAPQGPFSAPVLRSADRLPAYLMDGALAAPDPDAALLHLTDLLTHPHAPTVVEYLRAKPATLRGVMTLLGASDFLARLLARNPRWIDRLLGSEARVLQTRRHLDEAWERARAQERGLEQRLDRLRLFHAGQVVRLALAYLEGVLEDAPLAEELTQLAEFAVAAALSEAQEDLAEHGPLDRFLVVAMGRFGSFELGFGSDLDLVLLFDASPDDAPRYARLSKRLIHFLNTPMVAGILYQVDLALRPHGGKGTVVTTLAGFADYQTHHADAWERVALLRARPVAGPADARARFSAIQQDATRLDRAQIGPLVRRLDSIRERLRSEIARPKPGQYHLKYGKGGLMEVELVAQIQHLAALSALSEGGTVGGARILDVLAQLRERGLSAGDAAALASAYTFYRRLQNVLRLTHDRPIDHIAPADPTLGRLRTILGRRDSALGQSQGLEAALREHGETVHRIYRATIDAWGPV